MSPTVFKRRTSGAIVEEPPEKIAEDDESDRVLEDELGAQCPVVEASI
jgi:hypothetical protein